MINSYISTFKRGRFECIKHFSYPDFSSSMSLGLSKIPLTWNWRRSRVKKEILVKSHGSHSCLWWGSSSSTYIPLLPISSFYSSLLFFIAHSTNKWKYSTIYIWLNLELNCKFYYSICIDWPDIDSFWCIISIYLRKKQSWFLVLM